MPLKSIKILLYFQRYQYISDALGYRLISGSHLPEAPVHVVEDLPATLALVGPDPVEETAEVKAARATHEAVFRKAADAAAAAPVAAAPAKPEAETPVADAVIAA